MENMTQLHVAFVTDGDLSQALGIACIIDGLTSHLEEGRFAFPVWIITPKYELAYAVTRLLADYNVPNLRSVEVEARTSDKYYIQLGLSRLFELLNPNDGLISMDYDHVVLDPIKFPFKVPSSGVKVSSEVFDTDTNLGSQIINATHNDILPVKHLNASLIYGKVQELRGIGRHWARSYDELSPFIPKRHLVEIAFSLASERANITAFPCEISIQANFTLPSRNTCIFHFGGESPKAKLMKAALSDHANQLSKGIVRRKQIRSIRKNLTCHLQSLLQ
jgi:hypothetical protein